MTHHVVHTVIRSVKLVVWRSNWCLGHWREGRHRARRVAHQIQILHSVHLKHVFRLNKVMVALETFTLLVLKGGDGSGEKIKHVKQPAEQWRKAINYSTRWSLEKAAKERIPFDVVNISLTRNKNFVHWLARCTNASNATPLLHPLSNARNSILGLSFWSSLYLFHAFEKFHVRRELQFIENWIFKFHKVICRKYNITKIWIRGKMRERGYVTASLKIQSRNWEKLNHFDCAIIQNGANF